MSVLAINGGSSVRKDYLPYARQIIDEVDINAVVNALRAELITTGPLVDEFERSFANYVGAKEAVAVSNGTAALHAAIFALGIEQGDEVIVPTMTFSATANAVVYQGGNPVFVDVEDDTLLIDPAKLESKITKKTKAIISVDYSGHPCNYDALQNFVEQHGLALVADASHALGARYKNRMVGTVSDLTTFSLHPVKHITSGEGGVVTTNNFEFARRMRLFRNHGITCDHRQRATQGSWYYEIQDLGYNYRLTDIQCALGISQLEKLPGWLERRQEISKQYDHEFAQNNAILPLKVQEDVYHAYHLYVVRFDLSKFSVDRAQLFAALRAEGIGVNVHYIPVHLHPFYQNRFGTAFGNCPIAEKAYEEILTLPLFPAMTGEDVESVIEAVWKIVKVYSL